MYELKVTLIRLKLTVVVKMMSNMSKICLSNGMRVISGSAEVTMAMHAGRWKPVSVTFPINYF